MGEVTVNKKKYKCESMLISRNKDFFHINKIEDKLENGEIKPEFKYTIMIKLFNVKDPHTSTDEFPTEEFDFENITITSFIGFPEINLLTLGADLLINHVETIEIKVDEETLLIVNKD